MTTSTYLPQYWALIAVKPSNSEKIDAKFLHNGRILMLFAMWDGSVGRHASFRRSSPVVRMEHIVEAGESRMRITTRSGNIYDCALTGLGLPVDGMRLIREAEAAQNREMQNSGGSSHPPLLLHEKKGLSEFLTGIDQSLGQANYTALIEGLAKA